MSDAHYVNLENRVRTANLKGVSDFADFKKSLVNKLGGTRVVSFTGRKGGCSKSTLSSGLSMALTKFFNKGVVLVYTDDDEIIQPDRGYDIADCSENTDAPGFLGFTKTFEIVRSNRDSIQYVVVDGAAGLAHVDAAINKISDITFVPTLLDEKSLRRCASDLERMPNAFAIVVGYKRNPSKPEKEIERDERITQFIPENRIAWVVPYSEEMQKMVEAHVSAGLSTNVYNIIRDLARLVE